MLWEKPRKGEFRLGVGSEGVMVVGNEGGLNVANTDFLSNTEIASRPLTTVTLVVY
jgi:hypothetical protein